MIFAERAHFPSLRMSLCVRSLLQPILLTYVFVAWHAQLVIEFLRKKRDSAIHITDLNVVHHGNGLLVVDKCPELLINSRQPWLRCLTLQMQIFFAFPQYANFELEHLFHFINRLDAPTSGLICIAYTPKMAGVIGKAFQHRNVKKRYLAVVWGHVDDACTHRTPNYAWKEKYSIKQSPIVTSGGCLSVCHKLGRYEYIVDFPIGEFRFTWPDGRRQKIVAPSIYPDCIRPKPSQTKVTVLKHGYLDGLPASYLQLEPLTGRRHQLRVHCAVGLGHPIAGDLTYARLHGRDIAFESANYNLERMMLHADSLEIKRAEKIVKRNKNESTVDIEVLPNLQLFSTRNLFPETGRNKWHDKDVFYES